jgi:predicted DNA-binding transcriptional regulator YafY
MFKDIPNDIDANLRGSANIWFRVDKKLKVKVQVDADCAHYFKRRKMFPTQDIKEERPDGSLNVSYRVGCYEEIISVIKAWIPHMVILEPEELKEALLIDLTGWVARQGNLGSFGS